jgi:cytochrome c oxidase subunit 3
MKNTTVNINNRKFRKFFGKTSHNYHLVTPSPWPLITSQATLFLAIAGISYMRFYPSSIDLFICAVLFLVLSASFWWKDVVRESTFEGNHVSRVQSGIKIAFALFIISEIMFFFAFFWGFFHSSIAPTAEIGAIWPPKGILVFDMKYVPFLNTLVLATSGCTITWAHHALTAGNKTECQTGLMYTIILAVIFTLGQAVEYIDADFTISDSVFGSVFFMTTGFHGFHVFVGTCFLVVNYIRLRKNNFTIEHHLGFELGAWYWHFVDTVWLLLFVLYYGWGC